MSETNATHSENAVDILKEYHASIGGSPKPDGPKKKGPKAGSKRSSAAANFDSPEVSTKKNKRKSGGVDVANGTPITDAKGKKMPDGSWENLVTVSSILEENAETVKGSKQKSGTVLMALLVWEEDGRKTQHPLGTARYKCPQRLLEYYERHL
jgi:chromobox protein 1